MRQLRILVANEPRAYREAIAHTLQHLRPLVDVVEVEPGHCESVAEGSMPDIVICSRRSDCRCASAPAWVVLYPEGETRVLTRVFGEYTVTAQFELDDLLSVIDRTCRLAQFREPGLAQMS